MGDDMARISGATRRLASRVARRLLSGILSEPAARVVSFMATTGAGTDRCLERGALPVKVHYFSPVPDIAELRRRGVWGNRSEMPGVAFRPDEQLALLRQLGDHWADECSWPQQSDGDPSHFYLQNGAFSYGCAAGLHAMIREERPRRVIEVGSGNSTRVIAAALALNAREPGATPARYTVIDPFPAADLQVRLPQITDVVPQQVETMKPALFEELERGDILFVDSSHVVKQGSDVVFLVLEVLPRLRPGVVVHFHDIPMPYEYPEVYATKPEFRVFWNESYILQAFLCFNTEYEVMLSMMFAQHAHLDAFCAAFPRFRRDVDTSSGSIWLRRR